MADRHLIIRCFTSAILTVITIGVKFSMETNRTCKVYAKFNVIKSYKNGDSVRVTESV